MFKRKTVFVIGAGGSKDFDLPLGEELKGLIAWAVRVKLDQFGHPSSQSDRNFVNAIIQLCASADGKRGTESFYWTSAADMARGMPGAISIDNFLETHSLNQHITTVGKLGIASAILTAESKSKLAFNRSNINDKLDIANLKNTWLLEFVKILLDGVSKGDTSSFDKVEIVTFNYDRCIEEGLAYIIASQWILPVDEARIAAAKVKVTHVYGTVGLLPWQTGNGLTVEFGVKPNGAILNESASMLRTFSEKTESNAIEQEVLTKVKASERIVFIGFSFMSINMKFFALPEKSKLRAIIATSIGLSASDRELIQDELSNLYESRGIQSEWKSEFSLKFEDVKGAELLKNYAKYLAS